MVAATRFVETLFIGFIVDPSPPGDRDTEPQAASFASADMRCDRAGHLVGGMGVYR